MAKQTFTTGQVLTAAQMTSLQQTAMLGGSATDKTASYVLVAADAGTTVAMSAAGATTITVNTGLFAAGDTVFIQNRGAGACTVTAGTATVATAGSLILPQNDAGILYFTATGAAIFYDFIQAGAASPLTTKGDIYTFSTSDARLAVGTNTYLLTADSTAATGLKWTAPSSGGGGKVLQVVQGTSTTQKSITGGTFTDTTLTANITPTLNTSKVLVMVTQQVYMAPGVNSICSAYMRLMRDSTAVYTPSDFAAPTFTYKFIGSDALILGSFSYLDSPATTSSTTYKTQACNSGNGAPTLILQVSSIQSNIILMEIGA